VQIHGFNKTTLLDYPKHLACTIFLGNCNFRCPFCHNKGLVICPESQPTISETFVIDYLKKRRNIVEGVCITGGEPTLSPDLYDFILKIKELGYNVKLDTNGYRPDVLNRLLSQKMLDYVAMDIKASPENYPLLAGKGSLDINKIQESIDLIMSSGISYEFRTTLVKELHTQEDILSIGKWLKGCDSYYLQSYRDGEEVIQPGFTGFTKNELLDFQKTLQKYIRTVEIRGVD
jgi:pyruvate formate lyase activating enzyme